MTTSERPKSLFQNSKMSLSSLEHMIKDDDVLHFLHMPKAAGNTLGAILKQFFTKEEIAPFLPMRDVGRIPQRVFSEYRYFQAHIYYELMYILLPKEPIRLTMLREPIERFISNFAYLQRTSPASGPLLLERIRRKEGLRNMTLVEFVNNKEPTLTPIIDRIQNRQTQILGTKFNFATRDEMLTAISTIEGSDPQLDTLKIKSSPPALVEQAKERLNQFIFVGLVERFQDSLFLLAYTFGWHPIVSSQRLNAAPYRLSREKTPPKTMEKIIELNTLDLELYEYAQQLFETRFVQMSNELLERYGQNAHARLKLPLSWETMQELLEKHYTWRLANDIRKFD